MNITTKFDIGGKVWTRLVYPTFNMGNFGDFLLPIEDPVTVSAIYIVKTDKTESIKYKFNEISEICNEDEVFSTFEELKNYCNEYNSFVSKKR